MTLELRGVTKTYQTAHGRACILKDVDLVVEQGEHVGILGQNGAGKSTLIRILSGSERPTKGEVSRTMSVSWPLAFGGAFLGGLTGVDNVRFVCRLYGVDPDKVMRFVEDFTELGRYLREPFKTYSSGMRARLAFAVSMAIDFDCYLVDEIIAVGDDRFQRKCQVELFEKRRDKAMLIVSHNADFVRQHCRRASVLTAGHLTNFENIEGAYEFYSKHELSMQPHMAEAGPERPRQLRPNALEYFADQYPLLSEGEFEALLSESELDRVPVFDSCDVVGRLDNSGHTDAAMAIANHLTKAVPGEPFFWITLGDLLSKRRQHLPAVEAYRRAIDSDPQAFWAHRNLATEFFNVGRYRDAIPHYDDAIRLAVNDDTRLELQLRWIDCHYLLDASADLALPGPLPTDRCTIVDKSSQALAGHGASRLYVGGLLLDGRSENITCTFRARDQTWMGRPIFARNSIRRLSAVSTAVPFAFVCYTTVPSDVQNIDIEIRSHGEILNQANEPVEWMADEGTSTLDRSTAAKRAYDEHQHIKSGLLYGTCEFAGDQADRVPFAESLISLGYYDEAEWWLSQWLNDDADSLESGSILDLLCVEIARSRLPNWHNVIDELLAKRDRSSPSTLANLGHSGVARSDLKGAVCFYREASSAAADKPLVHFATGIHTAKFALDVPRIRLSPEKTPDKSPPEIVHLFACDATYFRRFGEKLVASSAAARGETDVIIHAHVIDPNEESMSLAEYLGELHDLRFTCESSPASIRDDRVRRAFFTCARFLLAPQLLREYRSPIMITETDCLVNWSWPDILDHVEGFDFGYMQAAVWNWVPWTKVPAGLTFCRPTSAGAWFSQTVASFIEHAFREQGGGTANLWTVDQVALWLAHMKAPKSSRIVHLPMSSLLTLATGDKANI